MTALQDGSLYVSKAREDLGEVVWALKVLAGERPRNMSEIYGSPAMPPRMGAWLVDKYLHHNPVTAIDDAINSLMAVKQQMFNNQFEFQDPVGESVAVD